MARAAQVRGFQGQQLGTPGRVVGSVKHFAGYGAAQGGRDYDGAYIPEEQLRNVYLPPFKAAIDAGVGTVMSAYLDLNDVPASGNRFLLRDLLRRDLGFTGFVVSDAMAVRRPANSRLRPRPAGRCLSQPDCRCEHGHGQPYLSPQPGIACAVGQAVSDED